MNTRTFALTVLVGCGGSPFSAADPAQVEGDGGSVVETSSAPTDSGGSALDRQTSAVEDGGEDGAPAEAGDASGEAAVEAEPPPVCVTDLSGVGTGDFSIHFVLTTAESGLTVGLLRQRSDCSCDSSGCPTSTTMWELGLGTGGGIVAATDDGHGHYVGLGGSNTLNDGRPHNVDVIRRGGKLWYQSDGMVNSAVIDDPYSFSTFPPLVVGSSTCAGATPAAGHAAITDICLTKS